jgi:hypothetical protein
VNATDPELAAYLQALPPDHRMIVQALRDLVRSAVPDAALSMRWNVPVFEKGGPLCYIEARPSHVNFGFFRARELPDPGPLRDESGRILRHIKLTRAEDVQEWGLRELVTAAVDLNLDDPLATAPDSGKPAP